MDLDARCPRCGAALPAGSAAGLCPACRTDRETAVEETVAVASGRDGSGGTAATIDGPTPVAPSGPDRPRPRASGPTRPPPGGSWSAARSPAAAWAPCSGPRRGARPRPGRQGPARAAPRPTPTSSAASSRRRRSAASSSTRASCRSTSWGLRRPPAVLRHEARPGPDPRRAARAAARDPADELPRFVAIFEQVCQTVAYAHARGVDPPRPEAVEHHGRRLRRGPGDGLGPGQGPRPRRRGRRGVRRASRPTRRRRSSRPERLRRRRRCRGPARCSGRRPTWPPSRPAARSTRSTSGPTSSRLGSILCEILTGRPAFAAGPPARSIARPRRAELADALARLDACGADAELIALARDCLAAEPADRPRDARAVSDGVDGAPGRRAASGSGRPSWRGSRPRAGRG